MCRYASVHLCALGWHVHSSVHSLLIQLFTSLMGLLGPKIDSKVNE